MLLNEFRKQHDRVEGQARTIADQQNEIARQREQIAELAAKLKQIEALSARMDSLEKLAAGR
jgi:uncharacterized coiled-coil protein SlyX